MAESTADETVRISVNSNDEGMSAEEKKEEKIKKGGNLGNQTTNMPVSL